MYVDILGPYNLLTRLAQYLKGLRHYAAARQLSTRHDAKMCTQIWMRDIQSRAKFHRVTVWGNFSSAKIKKCAKFFSRSKVRIDLSNAMWCLAQFNRCEKYCDLHFFSHGASKEISRPGGEFFSFKLAVIRSRHRRSELGRKRDLKHGSLPKGILPNEIIGFLCPSFAARIVTLRWLFIELKLPTTVTRNQI